MIVEVVGAGIRDADGRLLLVRKARTQRFMLPGGKREPDEDNLAALSRELGEELGVPIVSAKPMGRFEATAANEPQAIVRSSVYFAEISGEIRVAAEIDTSLWIDPGAPADLPFAPLIQAHILPALIAARSATRTGSR